MTTDPAKAVEEFLLAVGTLRGDQFAQVGRAAIAAGAKARSTARRSARLSAAEAGALEKAVRQAIEPLHGELLALGPGALASAISDTMSASRAILKRASLTPEEYAVLTGPFATVGVALPPA
ncbi:hypothetical protein [Agromyces sp. Marseille-Q5079]|uniref:hypothetical protein n=1 Tax=Agromyces sp. Marseille-Q5079 TaxID=3439059 RepID=UPI003D9CBA06